MYLGAPSAACGSSPGKFTNFFSSFFMPQADFFCLPVRHFPVLPPLPLTARKVFKQSIDPCL
jgi:hypothetical protein